MYPDAVVWRAAEVMAAGRAYFHDRDGLAGASCGQDPPPAATRPDFISRANFIDVFYRITALYECRGHNAPHPAEVFPLNSQGPVVG
jgi:hypothetical protein